jgi:hypothetical protein
VTNSDVVEITGFVSLAGVASCAVNLVALHLLPTGLSPRRNAVSQYGITRFRGLYRAQTISMAVAALAAAVGLGDNGLKGGSLAVALLGVCGLTRGAISWFPMDEPGAAHTETGRRHGLLAIVAFGSATIAAIHLGGTLGRDDLWGGAGGAIFATGVAMLAFLIGMGAARRQSGVSGSFGLIERGYYLSTIVFFSIVGIELVRLR